MNRLLKFKRVKTIVCLIVCFISLNSCDDGDIITVGFDFEKTFNACGDLVFYKTKENPPQSLSLLISSPVLALDQFVETEPDPTNEYSVILVNPETDPIILNETTNIFNYRTYSSLPSSPFCNDIPPADLSVEKNDISAGGIATIKTVLIEDDNDGIPAKDEDINGDGNFDNDDTDGDGIPNYLDADDDGDNVLTIAEDLNGDMDDNPLTSSLDTDLDGIPNYLDDDDDGDGFLTRNEETTTQDQNPINDVTTDPVINPDGIPDFLNALVKTNIPATAYREHTINQTFEISILLENISFEDITEDVIDFGTLSNSITSSSRSVTPTF